MKTTMQALKTTLAPNFSVGDMVYIAALGPCKVIEAFLSPFTVLDAYGTLYEVFELLKTPSKPSKGKHEQNRGVFA